ncbi:MAG TPA: hypothetical protein P5108_06520 [Marmoricola sp.]|nr:hypothetical protein [Nocardioidaceae bacterium]MCO5325215.1 hypothetical protein [Nocardioidaceae bacterium]HMY08848.1 hypothetical protein [Marmoricola sp.]HRV69088.1 hypothetical protein [Marmoricola sp.]
MVFLKILGMAAAFFMTAVGAMWTAQGLGFLGDLSDSAAKWFSLVGPALAGFGIALGYVIVRGPK